MYLRIDQRRIHYKTIGSGPPLMMVHGWGGSIYSLLKLAQLASANYHVTLIDLPGFGKSDPPPPHWGIEGYASCVEKIISKICTEPCIYFGHSFGGAIGVYLSAHHSPLIHSLIVCNTSFKRTGKVSNAVRILRECPAPVQSIASTLKPFLRAAYYRLFHRDSDIGRFPAIDNNLKKILSEDLTPIVVNIQCQTLIIWGEKDTSTPVIWAYELQKKIPRATLVVHPDIGHGLPLTKPDLVWQDIHDAHMKIQPTVHGKDL